MNRAIEIPAIHSFLAIGSVVALAALAFGFGYSRFAGDLQRATQRVAHGSRIAATACGPIEYAEMGDGPAILLVHGAGGGFDQAIEFAGELARRLEQVKAPTLVISLVDDLYGTFASARYTAAQIPGARFVGYASGGHVWVGHDRAVLDELLTVLPSAGNGMGAV